MFSHSQSMLLRGLLLHQSVVTHDQGREIVSKAVLMSPSPWYSKSVHVASCTLIRFPFISLVCGRGDGILLWFYFASPWLLIQLSIFSFAYEPLSVPSSMKRLLFFLLVWLFMVDLHKPLPRFDFSSLTVVRFANNLSQLESLHFLFSLWCLWW